MFVISYQLSVISYQLVNLGEHRSPKPSWVTYGNQIKFPTIPGVSTGIVIRQVERCLLVINFEQQNL